MMTPALAYPTETDDLPSAVRSPNPAETATTEWTERAQKILSHEIAFLMHESFRSRKDREAAHVGRQLAETIEQSQVVTTANKKLAGINVHYQRMCETPLLDPELEQACFRHYNWLKYRANVHRSKLDLKNIDSHKVVIIEQLLEQAVAIRNFIIQANCRLAMSIVKKYSDSSTTFDELLSESLSTLMGAVEKFDYSRGFRFSTYATQSIHRRLFRILSQRQRQRTRFVNNSEEALTSTLGTVESGPERHSQEELSKLQRLLCHLEQRERLIVEARFGLHTSGQKQTFLEIGKKLKISKERVRQLAERALLKLHSLAEELNFEPA